MYIVVIGWIYVVLMMSITEDSVVAGLMTFLMYGVLPLAIILYLTGGRQRRRNRALVKKQAEDSKANVMAQAEAHDNINQATSGIKNEKSAEAGSTHKN